MTGLRLPLRKLFFVYIFASVLSGPNALKDKSCAISLCDFLFCCLFNTLVPILLPKGSHT